MRDVAWGSLVLTALLAACQNDPSPPEDASRADASPIDLGALDALVDVPAAEVSLDAAPTDGSAMRCTSDRECSGRGLVCDRAGGACVECRTSTDCGDGGNLCLGGRCVVRVACASSRMCPGQVCDTARGYCVDCVSEVDCPSTERCVEGSCASLRGPRTRARCARRGRFSAGAATRAGSSATARWRVRSRPWP